MYRRYYGKRRRRYYKRKFRWYRRRSNVQYVSKAGHSSHTRTGRSKYGYDFKTVLTADSAISATQANIYAGGSTFSLTSFPGGDNYAAVFDQYRITHLQFIVTNRFKTDLIPTVIVKIDRDDVSTPTREQLLADKATKMKMLNAGEYVQVDWKPNILSTTSVVASGGYTAEYKKWFNCADLAVPYYGIKIYIDDFSHQSGQMNITTRAWVEFKGGKATSVD